MKRVCLLFTLLSFCLGLLAFESNAFGPTVDQLYFANLNDNPISFGARVGDQSKLILQENGYFVEYDPFPSGLQLRGSCKLNDNTLMVAMGSGTYSDGVYNFNLSSHQWSLNEWFFWPNFIKCHPTNGKYYVGERDGLYQSSDGITWTRITALGMNKCSSLAWFGQHMVCSIGSSVYTSSDAGVTWQQGGMGLLEKFRFTSSGTLYGIMDDLSDSDGLWRSFDHGASWELVFYSGGLSAVGQDYQGVIPIAWHTATARESYLAIMNTQDELSYMNHIDMNSGIIELEDFPLINPDSFYVINGSGCYFITNFGPVSSSEELLPNPSFSRLRVYPNPASSHCAIKLEGAAKTPAMIHVYNSRGQLVRKIALEEKHETQWNLLSDSGAPLPAGVYILQMKAAAGGKPLISRVVLM